MKFISLIKSPESQRIIKPDINPTTKERKPGHQSRPRRGGTSDGDLKSFQILTIKFRNRVKNMADQVILLVAGLCNLKNDYVVQ